MVEIYAKSDTFWVSEPHFGAVRGDARPWLMALCSQILPEQGRLASAILGIRNVRDTGLPDGDYRIAPRSLASIQYRSVTDGGTDRQTGGFAVAYTALAKLCFGAL